jgi:hypothetical protein
LRQSLDGFLRRTFSSNLVSESVRANRLIICLNAAHAALGPFAASRILDNAFNGHWDEALQSVEIGHALRLWGHGRDHDAKIRRIVARIIARVRERDDRWAMLVKEEFGVPDDVLRESLPHGDSVLLSVLIHASRQANHASSSWTSGILSSLSEFDIHNTLPGLQHDFCALWNETVHEARNQRLFSTSNQILREIRHLYIALHQDTDAAPTSSASSVSTDNSDQVLSRPWPYPFLNIIRHRPPSTTRISTTTSGTIPFPTQPDGYPSAQPHHSTLTGGAALRLPVAKETKIIAGRPCPSDQTTAGEIGESSQAPIATDPALSVHNSPVFTSAPPPGTVDFALLDIPSTATLSHPLEGNDPQDIVPACTEQDIGEFPSTGPTPTPTRILVPLPVSTPSVLNKLLASRDAAPASTSLSPTGPAPSVVGFAISGSCSPPQASPSNLANAMSQLLVHCPPFFNLFKDLGKLMGQQGLTEGQETGGSATQLVDATVKFLDEFVYKEKLFMTQQSQQNAAKGKVKGNEEGKNKHDVMDSFNPRYMYDALKEKWQLKSLLVCSRNQDAPFCD